MEITSNVEQLWRAIVKVFFKSEYQKRAACVGLFGSIRKGRTVWCDIIQTRVNTNRGYHAKEPATSEPMQRE